jgi:intraflagellar transport protein 122
LHRSQNGSYKLTNEKQIGFYPCAISLLGSQNSKSSYLVVSGSHKKATMFSKEGVRLADLIKKDAWVWGCACSPIGDRLVIGSNSGSIDTLQMDFVSVHALFRDRYAYRENLTEIIVHHLVQDRKVRIKCKDLIRHISLYKNKLAVHLTDRVCIYESSTEDSTDMHFRVRKERMTLRPSVDNVGCDKMAVTALYVLFCTGNVIESYSFDGLRHRVWMLDSPVSFMKVDGGPDGKEGILVGLQNGSLHKIYVQSPFPVELTKCKKAIISADLSFDRSLVATVDASATLTVTNLKTQNVLLTTNGVSSVCFNTDVANVLCYSSEKSIYVVSGLGNTIVKSDGTTALATLEPQEQYISGQAIGFQGQRIYCLHRGSITSIDVPQVKYMLKALDNNDCSGAYSTACLGVTETDWKMLAIRSLRSNALSVAKNSFARLKDMKFLGLIEQIERTNSSNDAKSRNLSLTTLDTIWNAELLAYEGHFSEAAKSYARINKIDDAIRIFTDMRMWEDAITLSRNAGKKDVNDLTIKQAQWLKDTKDWKGSSDLYLALGNHFQAAKVIADAATDSNSWQQALIEVVRSTPSDNVETLQFCGKVFTDCNEDAYARETYIKVGDVSKLMQLYISKQMWDEAAKLADENVGKFDASVFLPYAEWLVSKDRFVDAMSAFNKAERKDLSRNLLNELTKSAIIECRYKDAAFYYWKLSKEFDGELNEKHYEHIMLADLYYAYATIHSFVTDPFTSHQPETLFQTSRFILNSLGSTEIFPLGLSKASILYTLARQSMTLGTFNLARVAFEKLSKLKMPDRKQDEIELDMMIVQAKPVRDNTDYLPVCYRCGATNPLLSPMSGKFSKADICTNCGHPFVRSFVSFEVLPLVEFVPDPSIGDEEAMELIRQSKSDKSAFKSNEYKEGEADVFRLDADNDEGDYGSDGSVDLFSKCLNRTLSRQVS